MPTALASVGTINYGDSTKRAVMTTSKIIYPRLVEVGSDANIQRFSVELEASKSVPAKEYSLHADSFTVFPFDVKSGGPKYKKLRSITFEGFNGKTPRGFFKEFTRGYGFTRALAPVFYAIEDRLGVPKIIISKTKPTKLYKYRLVLNADELDRAFPTFTNLFKEQKEDKDHITSTTLHAMLPASFSITAPKYTKGSLSAFIKKRNIESAALSGDDVDAMVKLLNAGRKTLDRAQVLATKQVIEEFYIEDVLSEMDDLLAKSDAKQNEEKWQVFFKKYNWIFSQFFSSPVMLFKDKAYVGGKGLDDTGGKIADFIYKNSLTQNVAIIEIKTHKTALLKKRAYRGRDVFSVSDELSGALSQVLDQRDKLHKQYYEIARDTKEHFEAHSAKCLIVIGRTMGLTDDQLRAFELFRANSRDVEINTFDEVYEKLKALQSLMKGKPTKSRKKKPATT